MDPGTACAGGRRGWSTAVTFRGIAKHCPCPVPDTDLSSASLFPACRVQPLSEMVLKSPWDLGGQSRRRKSSELCRCELCTALGLQLPGVLYLVL